LLRFLRRQRWDIRFLDFDEASGLLVCNCVRVWHGVLLVPQSLAFVGRATSSSLGLTALADVRPAARYDFGRCEKNLDRLVRYFSLPPA